MQLSAAAQLRHTPNNINVILQFLTLNCKSEGEERGVLWVGVEGVEMGAAEAVEVNEPLAMTAAARDVLQRVSCSFQVCLTRARSRRLCLPTEDQVEFRKPWHVSAPLSTLDSRLSALKAMPQATSRSEAGGIATLHCCFDFKASLASGQLNCLRN